MNQAVDPLAALEAEYAAVLAQNCSLSNEISSIPSVYMESSDSDSEDDESAAVDSFESYVRVPSSPCISDAEVLELLLDDLNVVDRDVDKTQYSQNESKDEELSLQWKDVRLEESKRVAIMRSMEQVKLYPPPWAQAANMTDEELVKIVKRQFGLMNKAE